MYASQILSAPDGTEIYDYDLGVWKIMYNLTVPAGGVVEKQVLTQVIYSPTESILNSILGGSVDSGVVLFLGLAGVFAFLYVKARDARVKSVV